MTDVLLVSLGGTAGLRAADGELAGSLRRAGASVDEVSATPPPEVRTFVLTDLLWARAARRAAASAPEFHRARAVIYSSITAALLWPRPGAIRFDALAAGNRPGHHGLWQRPLERRRLAEAPLLLPWSASAMEEAPAASTPAVVVPVPVEPSGGETVTRDLAAITYAANPRKKGLDRVLEAWRVARRDDEELVVAGVTQAEVRSRLGALPAATQGVRFAGRLRRAEYRGLVRRARVFVTAPRREDYGIAQLEALADGAMLVTAAAPGPYAALPLAREIDPRLVTDDLATALRAALDDPAPGYSERARVALEPFRREAVDAQVAKVAAELLS